MDLIFCSFRYSVWREGGREGGRAYHCLVVSILCVCVCVCV